MADGGDFGYDDPNLDRNIDNDYENDDDYDQEEENTTQHFQLGAAFDPHAASTPVEQYEMRTMVHEQSGLTDTSYEEIPSLGNFLHQEDKQCRLEQAKNYIERRFPNVDFGKLCPIGFSKAYKQELFHLGEKGARTKFLKRWKRASQKLY